MIVIIIIVIIILLCRRQRTHKQIDKGKEGERNVARLLANLSPEKYIVFNDLLLRSGNYSTQIDHVVISVYGIFVIETKNHAGIIFGNEMDEEWTQTINYSYSGKICNPVLQNQKHINALKRLLYIPDTEYIFSIITFSRNCNLCCYTTTPTIYYDELLQTVRSYRIKKISGKQVKSYAEKINAMNDTSTKGRKAHVRRIKKLYPKH